jgi:hypothetical protein
MLVVGGHSHRLLVLGETPAGVDGGVGQEFVEGPPAAITPTSRSTTKTSDAG